jgi:hypothetical protein
MNAYIHSSKDETPTAVQGKNGVSRKQAEMFVLPVFCPLLPPKSSTTKQVFLALMKRDVTQLTFPLFQQGGAI